MPSFASMVFAQNATHKLSFSKWQDKERLARKGVDYAVSGGYLADIITTLEAMKAKLRASGPQGPRSARLRSTSRTSDKP